MTLGKLSDSTHSLASQAIIEPPAYFFLFAQHLHSLNHRHEELACLRMAYRHGLRTRHFLFYHGLLAATDGCLDEASALYMEGLLACLKDGELPSTWGSQEISEYLRSPKPAEDIAHLLKETTALWPAPDDEGKREPAATNIPAPLLQIEVLNLIAEDLINYHNDFICAREVYALRHQRQQAWLLEACGWHSTTLFLSDDWTRNLGHIAFLGHLTKMQQLSDLPQRLIGSVMSGERPT